MLPVWPLCRGLHTFAFFSSTSVAGEVAQGLAIERIARISPRHPDKHNYYPHTCRSTGISNPTHSGGLMGLAVG